MAEKNNLIIGTDNLYTYMKEVEEGGKNKANIYACSSGVPTIGVGFALLIKNTQTKKWLIREELFSKNGVLYKAGVTLPSDDEISDIEEVLEDIIEKLNDDDKKKAKKLVKDNSTTLNKLTINENQSKELFKILQAKYEGYLINRIVLKGKMTKDKAKKIIKALATGEQIALYSCVYNALTVIGPSLSKALKNYTEDGVSEKDKAYYKTKAWYEIRYNSHKTGWAYISGKENEKAEGDNGLANRRYKDSLKFGLYGLSKSKQNNLSQNIKDGILNFLNSNEGRSGEKVTETIKKYEKEFSPSVTTLGNKKQDKIEEIIKRLEEKIDPVGQIEAEAQKKGRRLDNLSKEFLIRYNKKYKLILKRSEPIYYNIKRIEDYSDILIFQLMDRLVANMEQEEELAKKRNEDKKRTQIRKLVNRCKSILEEIIKDMGGYERTAYVEDNQADLTHEELKKELVSAFKSKGVGGVKTTKSHKFFESFLNNDDKKAVKEEEKQKREERRKERLKEENKREEERKERDRQRYAANNKQKEKQEGWVIFRENGEYVHKKRG